MKALKKLFNTKTKIVIAIVILAIVILWVILFFVSRDTALGLLKPLLWTFLIVAVSWLAIHFGLKAWRKRKRGEFDQAVAAKEGIEDRRREWATWTAELEKQGIDRYELPFYLLVGEPQSGKSVLLHNSDLHFPFGQNRLSGVGGTRGCDWWFTEEAVILDLAGRLFTHEGGAADRLEFEAFLQLLYEFRPLCPANGVILVIPCDSLLKDSAEQCGAKATKIQNALLTLTTNLQAQLPVYLVLTKGDQIFGFAESVHRLDVERRHQMFGWSRPAEKIDTPFDVAEVVQGFEELVRRSRLLRAHMSAGARLPEALPEIDRMYAFPHELAGMQPNLEAYLKRIFTASNITDRVFFRGLYLTSGLQSGVPIAKVCTELFGKTGEADMRDLQALFSKPRAYFIKDLVRNRVFGERGLVRPTQGRVQQTRRTAVVGYGLSGLVVAVSVIWAGVFLLTGETDDRQKVINAALAAGQNVPQQIAPQELLLRLQQISEAAQLESAAYEKTYGEPRREGFRRLYCELFDTQVVPLVRSEALASIDRKLSEDSFKDDDDLDRICSGLSEFTGNVDFSKEPSRKAVLACLDKEYRSPQPTKSGEFFDLARSFEVRDNYADQGENERLVVPWTDADGRKIVDMALAAITAIEHSMEPGATTAPDGEVGYMVAWYQAVKARDDLNKDIVLQKRVAIQPSVRFAQAMRTLNKLEEGDLARTKTITMTEFLKGGAKTYRRRLSLIAFIRDHDAGRAPQDRWPLGDALTKWSLTTLQDRGEAPYRLNDIGIVLGNDDLGQTLYQKSDEFYVGATTKLKIGEHAEPLVELDKGLRPVCEESLPSSLADGALAEAIKRVRKLNSQILEKEDADSQAFTVFLVQCEEEAKLFAELDADEAVRAFGEDPGTKQLCMPLLEGLAGQTGLHREVADLIKRRDLQGSMRESMLGWQRSIERILLEHIESRERVKDWVPAVPVEGTFPEEAWRILGALGEAARLPQVARDKYKLDKKAEDVQQAAFFELAGHLVERWEGRDEARLEDFAKTVDELDRLAGEMNKLGPSAEALKEAGQLTTWSGRVDGVLAKGLDHIRDLVKDIWVPETGQVSLADALRDWRHDLDTIDKKIELSSEQGLEETGRLVNRLKEGSPIATLLPKRVQTTAAVTELADFAIPVSDSEVTKDKEYDALDRAIDQLLTLDDGAEGYGQDLAGRYLKDFQAREAPAGQTNAGVRLVREIRAQLKRMLCQEIQSAYLDDLAELLHESKYNELYDLLFWDPSQKDAEVDNDVAMEALARLLDPGGEFAKLGERYKLHGKKPEDPSIGKDVFPAEPLGEEHEWAPFHQFLSKLGPFLLGDQKRMRDAKITFRIRPSVEVTRSVWNDTSLSREQRREFFYYPANAPSELKGDLNNSRIGVLSVRNWDFGTGDPDRRLRFFWSDTAQPAADGQKYSFEVPSGLAPLLLAWSGTPVSEDEPTEFDVVVDPEGTELPAPLRIEFEQTLPLRPAAKP